MIPSRCWLFGFYQISVPGIWDILLRRPFPHQFICPILYLLPDCCDGKPLLPICLGLVLIATSESIPVLLLDRHSVFALIPWRSLVVIYSYWWKLVRYILFQIILGNKNKQPFRFWAEWRSSWFYNNFYIYYFFYSNYSNFWSFYFCFILFLLPILRFLLKPVINTFIKYNNSHLIFSVNKPIFLIFIFCKLKILFIKM